MDQKYKQMVFSCCLGWARRADMAEFDRGYILGAMAGAEVDYWQREYVRNVLNARRRGVSA